MIIYIVPQSLLLRRCMLPFDLACISGLALAAGRARLFQLAGGEGPLDHAVVARCQVRLLVLLSFDLIQVFYNFIKEF